MTLSLRFFPLLVVLLLSSCSPKQGGAVDSVVFGDASSEKSHGFSTTGSEVIKGGLGDAARRLLPPKDPQQWAGGTLSFTIKVDPEKANYATVRFWGDDTSDNRMLLFVDGKQIGYRHLGDIDGLDYGSEDPVYNGRFYYVTTPLPVDLTKGKKSVVVEVRSYGPIWVYGQTFDKYQKPMTTPSRALYALHTHTEGFFVPPGSEKQGAPVLNPPVRKAPGKEVLDQVKLRVNREVEARLKDQRPPNQMQIQLLARAWSVAWTLAFRNQLTVDRVVAGMDDIYRQWVANPKLAEADPVTPNAEWFGLSFVGQALWLLSEPLAPLLDQPIDDGKGGSVTRRQAYADMLVASRDWHRQHRRLYTNQTMINDMYGIYFCNKGLSVIAPERALPEEEALRYLYESVGLQPWTDSDQGGGSPAEMKGKKNWNVGSGYMQLTAKGLTKELGFVGNYGEVIDWVTAIYKGTAAKPGEPGDPKIREQLLKIIQARAPFRYPMLDAEGNRAMRLEAVIGWRDHHIPGDILYCQRPSWDAGALDATAATLDPGLMGYARQMLDDNQFFSSVQHQMEKGGLRVTIGLLDVPDDYEAVSSWTGSAGPKLPMSEGSPDLVWSDEEDGVVAIKNGDEILYASLYWRARNAVNFLARIHHLTPTLSRVAVVRQKTEFTSSGLTYKRPAWTNTAFGNGGVKYNDGAVSAHAGEELPIAKIPDGITFKPGEESVHAGKGDFYTLQYGPYLIGMNMTKEKTFDLEIPVEFRAAKNLSAGKSLSGETSLKVAPRSTLVLYLPPK